MRKIIIALAVLSFSAHLFAANTSANQGHHSGANHGMMGAAAGAFGGSNGSSSAGQSGMGGSYWSPNPRASLIDAYQPWPQSEMAQYQKP